MNRISVLTESLDNPHALAADFPLAEPAHLPYEEGDTILVPNHGGQPIRVRVEKIDRAEMATYAIEGYVVELVEVGEAVPGRQQSEGDPEMRDLAEIRARLEHAKRERAEGVYIGAMTYDPLIADVESLLVRVEAIEAEMAEWDTAVEPDGSQSIFPVRMAATFIRAAMLGAVAR